MDIKGEYLIAASPSEVWQALNDETVLSECIPGCQAVNRIDDENFECEVRAKFGPVKATFHSVLQIEQSEPPHFYVLAGEGKGGAAGFGKGRAEVRLEAENDATRLSYVASVSIGGKLAQIGSRLLSSTTKKLSDQFFDAFHAQFTQS